MKNLLLSTRNMPLRMQKDSDNTYKLVMVSHRQPFILRKRSELQKKKCFINDTPRNTLKAHLEGVNRCMVNLMINDAELKTNCNTLSVTKECS